jgi:hypothetical protein
MFFYMGMKLGLHSEGSAYIEEYLRTIYRARYDKRDEVTKDWRKSHNGNFIICTLKFVGFMKDGKGRT